MTDLPAITQTEETPDVQLAMEHHRLSGLVAALEHEGLDLEAESTSVSELAAASQHQADLASETFERERDLALLNEFRAELDANEDAAMRLATGRYGWCHDCNQPIDLDRLAAVPATNRCKTCQEHYELDMLLEEDGAEALLIQPADLADYLPGDDEDEPAPELGPEEAALHIEG